MHYSLIDHIGTFFLHNLVVFVGVVLLPMKWFSSVFWRDDEAQANALLSVPEDLCYVTLGLILGDVINSAGRFRIYFSQVIGSDHVTVDLGITVIAGMLISVGLHKLAQECTAHFNRWRAAQSSQMQADGTGQGILPLKPVQEGIFRLSVMHLFSFLLFYVVQMVIVLFWLHWVAKVVAAH